MTALKRARERAAKAKEITSAEAEATESEDPLLLYAAVLTAAADALGNEVREQKAVLNLSQRGAWDEPKAAPAKAHDFVLDQAGVLLNLAASWSSRGALPPLTDGEAIKAAAKHFQLAAGAVQAAQAVQPAIHLSPCPSDLSDEALGALRAFMLAQAQACFCEKAEKDGMGAGTQAKLCMGAQQLYVQAADGLHSFATTSKGLHAWGHAVASARAKQYEALARWHAASESGAAERRGEQQAQLQLCVSLAGAASAALASHSAMSDAAKASLAALVAKSGEALRTVSRDNELVYYAKVPPSDSLPAIEAKVLAKPTPVAPLVEAVGALPPPPTIVKPEEAVIGGGGEDGDGFGEALGRLFSRLGSEFKMIPLSDRRANEREEEEAMRRARQVAKEAEKREAAEKGGALSALGALFGGGGGGSAKSGSGGKSEEGSRGKQEKKKEESKDGSSSSSSAKKRQGKDDGGDGDDGATEEDRALQAALAASLKEVSVSKSSSAPASNATANTASGSLRPPSARPDLLSRALSASSGGGGGGSFAPSAMEYPSFDSRRAPPPPPPPPPAPMGYGASYGSGPLVDLSDTHPPPPPPAFPAYNSALGGGGLPPPPSFDEATSMPSSAAVEGQLAQLTQMGFTRSAALDALKACSYDVTAAADRLLC